MSRLYERYGGSSLLLVDSGNVIKSTHTQFQSMALFLLVLIVSVGEAYTIKTD